MDVFYGGIGICIRCGDMEGPWTWYDGIGWLCDECSEKEEKKDEQL